MRGVSSGIEGGLGGAYQRACDAYAVLDFENTTSVARFLCEHVTNFEPPREDDMVCLIFSARKSLIENRTPSTLAPI